MKLKATETLTLEANQVNIKKKTSAGTEETTGDEIGKKNDDNIILVDLLNVRLLLILTDRVDDSIHSLYVVAVESYYPNLQN